MKKLLNLLLCSVCILALLSGCSKTVSKEQILKDIRDEDYVYDEYDLTITDYSESRYEGKQDEDKLTIEVTIIAENDVFEYTCEYKLLYVRYSDGWKLKTCADEIISTEAKVDLKLSQVEKDIQDYYREALAEYQLTEESFGEAELIEDDAYLTSFIPYRLYAVPFTGRNDMIQVDADLTIGYQLDHDKGRWVVSKQLKSGQPEFAVTVLADPDSAVAEFMTAEGMESYEIISKEKDDYSYTERYDYEIIANDLDGSKYASRVFEYELYCYFDAENGWTVNGNPDKDLVDAELHADGFWLYDDGTGENVYEIQIYKMTLDSITMSYDLTLKFDWDEEIRYESSDGIVTIPLNASSPDEDTIKIVTQQDIAGPEGKGAGSYKLRFWSYSGEQYEESGFYINGCQLKKIT